MDRRTLLRRVGGIFMVAVAGCTGDTDETGGGGGDGGDASPTETPSPSHTASPTPSPQPTATDTETPVAETAEPTEPRTTTATQSPTATPTPTDTAGQTVEVAPDGSFTFEPKDFTIAVGETVTWVWRAGGHNVKVESAPSGSDWSGTPGGDSETFGEGYTHSHTFETAGRYEYFCAPHRSLGMTGQFSVE